MWRNKKLFADEVDSNPEGPPKKKKRCTRKDGEDESNKAAATASTGTRSVTSTTNQAEQHGGLSLGLSTNDASRKRKALNKNEKQQIKKSLSDLRPEVTTVISLVNVRKQLPSSNQNVEIFCNFIVPNSIMFLAEHWHQIFVKLYGDCSTMKEKYLQFQIKWHRHCSYFLVEKNAELSLIGLHPADPSAEAVVSVRSQWNKLCVANCLQRSDAKIFMILFCGCLYDELLRQCHRIIEPDIQASELCSEDSEDVYYRFGESTLRNMLHDRYTKIKSCPLNQKDRVSEEITVLQQLSVHRKEDKDHVPDYLKYRDEGHMCFPCVELLPFLKATDIATKKETNNTTFSQQGSDMLTTIVEKLYGDPNLQSLFVTTVVNKVFKFDDLPFATLDILFKELVKKLCHIRIQEYLDAFKHKGAAHKGKATLVGQNLRDSLLTHHINLKSKQ